jgi:hypothetical protein
MTTNQIEQSPSNNNQIKLSINLPQINTSLSNQDQFNANIIQSANNNKQLLSTANNNNNNNTNNSGSSSNTIRNLLAMNTSQSITNATIQNNKINNNIRLSAGVGTLLSQHQPQLQQQLIDLNTHNSVSIDKKSTNLNHNQDVHSNQPAVGSLLSVILAPTAIQIENNNKNTNKLVINEDDQTNLTKPANKRGRKSTNNSKNNKNDLFLQQKQQQNQQQDVYMRNESIASNASSINQPLVMDIDLAPEKNSKETCRKKKNSFSNNLTFQTNNNYNHQNSASNSLLVINDATNSNSPIDGSVGSNSNSHLRLNDFNNSFKQNIVNKSVSNDLSISNNTGMVPINTASSSSRIMSRSNSVNSINTVNEMNGSSTNNMTSAEQKRRCNIQHGFDRLQVLVPSLRDGRNAKASKAAMLQKTSEYIKELQMAREKRLKDLDVYKKQIEELSDKISECQSQLPATGVSVIGNLNKMEKFEQKFNQYVKEKTVDNWKFYLFSLILKPLFDNFVTNLNTSSKEDMERTFYEWQQKYCNLIQLRPSKLFFSSFFFLLKILTTIF